MHSTKQESVAHSTVTIVSSQKARTPTERGEDVILIDRRCGLVALLDAVGGRGNWRKAAEEAAQTIQAGWKGADLAQEASTEKRLSILIERADVRVASLIVPEGQRPPGTTVVLAAFSFNQIIYRMLEIVGSISYEVTSCIVSPKMMDTFLSQYKKAGSARKIVCVLSKQCTHFRYQRKISSIFIYGIKSPVRSAGLTSRHTPGRFPCWMATISFFAPMAFTIT